MADQNLVAIDELPKLKCNAGAIRSLAGSRIFVRDRQTGLLGLVNVKNKHESVMVAPGIEGPEKNAMLETAIVNQEQKLMAYHFGNTTKRMLVIWNLEKNAKINSVTITQDVDVRFWKWINNTVIIYATTIAVYLWDATNTSSEPKEIFGLHPNLQGKEIADIRAIRKNVLVIGAPQVGQVQFWSASLAGRTPVEAQAAELCTFGPQPSNLIIWAGFGPGRPQALNIRELAHPDASTFQAQNRPLPLEEGDYPVGLHVSTFQWRFSIISMVTQRGYLILFDLETATPLARHRISNDGILSTFANPTEPTGFYVVTTTSVVYSISVTIRYGQVLQGMLRAPEYVRPVVQRILEAVSAPAEPSWIQIIGDSLRSNPQQGYQLAQFLDAQAQGAADPLPLLEAIAVILQSRGPPEETVKFISTVMKNEPNYGNLQTQLLEMALMNAPQIAHAILSSGQYSYFDKSRVASVCERAGLVHKHSGLLQCALELCEDPEEVKGIIVKIAAIPDFSPEWLPNFFGKLSVEQSLDCLDVMLRTNLRQNLAMVVQVATQYSQLLTPIALINLFDKHKSTEGLYNYLRNVYTQSEDPDVHFKYIEAATQMGERYLNNEAAASMGEGYLNDVELVCRESNHYNPEKVKNFLKEASSREPRLTGPLMIVCDRFNFVHDLVLYLYPHQFQMIEAYVQRINSARTPAVVGALLDLDCDEARIKSLLGNINPAWVPIDELVSEVETRNRLKMLLPFLEATLAAGNQQQAVYNALAKIYIDSNNNPEKFLKEHDQYDTLVVGKYCEKRDPNLAYICYRKGNNDLELVNITNENSMYKAQARYLLERGDRELWMFVLNENNIHRRSVVDHVISTAVPESTDPAKVSEAIACFLAADLPAELIELLEKIILEPSPFSDNPNLQNLLIFTAAKADKARVMDYIHRIDGFNPQDITSVCIDVGLYEEAFEVYKKIGDKTSAADVLIEHIVSIDRAQAYAEDVDLPEVWSKVAKAQLDGVRVSDSIASYLKAEDPKNYIEVIDIATQAGKNEDLVKYLRMARKTLREPAVDTALAFCYARLDQLSELEDFLRGLNVADIEASGDKSYSEGHFQAAKIFYSSISNWAKLATTQVHLGDYQAAVESARKANSIKVWKEVHEACVERKEFRLAQICGLNLIVDAEQLQALVKQYERNGFFDELISLLENGLGLERAHMGMFTELGIALSKYRPERLIEHLNLFWSRMNLPKMIRACEEANLWPELVFCYIHYDEFDNAALTVMERPENSWEHQQFREIIVKVANLELYYKGLNFYREQHPSLLTDLLRVLTPRINVTRVVNMFRNLGRDDGDDLPMIKPFLLNVQSQNKRVVNDAINDLLIDEEDYKTLRDSVENYDNFGTLRDPSGKLLARDEKGNLLDSSVPDGSLGLAWRLEEHDLIFFRQIAASIYRKNKKWAKSIELYTKDKLWSDAIETAVISGKPDVAEELLRYFVGIGNRECYVATLYACNSLIRPDIALEMSWRHGLSDFTMPYMINVLCQQTKELAMLKADNEARKAKEKEREKKDDSAPILGGNRLMITAGPSGSTSPAPFSTGPNGFMAPQPTGYGY